VCQSNVSDGFIEKIYLLQNYKKNMINGSKSEIDTNCRHENYV